MKYVIGKFMINPTEYAKVNGTNDFAMYRMQKERPEIFRYALLAKDRKGNIGWTPVKALAGTPNRLKIRDAVDAQLVQKPIPGQHKFMLSEKRVTDYLNAINVDEPETLKFNDLDYTLCDIIAVSEGRPIKE